MRYHKKRQLTFKAYQDPYFYQPAKILQRGLIKITKYPQELEEPTTWNHEHYKGFLMVHRLHRPKIMLKGSFRIDLLINDRSLFSPFTKMKQRRQQKKVDLQRKAALDNLSETEKKLREDLDLNPTNIIDG